MDAAPLNQLHTGRAHAIQSSQPLTCMRGAARATAEDDVRQQQPALLSLPVTVTMNQPMPLALPLLLLRLLGWL